jgi:ribosome modulation factor
MIALTVQDEGAAAAAKGRSVNWCPYDEGDPRRDQWMKGWRDDDPAADTTANKKRRYPRRVADHILTAFHRACDQRDLEVAEQLLAVLAGVITGGRHQPTAPDRHDQESLVAAYERLWDLRHPCGWGAR